MEHIQLMTRARDEIRSLRARNEQLEAQNRVLDIFAAALLGTRTQGVTEDIAWKLDCAIRELRTPPQEQQQGE